MKTKNLALLLLVSSFMLASCNNNSSTSVTSSSSTTTSETGKSTTSTPTDSSSTTEGAIELVASLMTEYFEDEVEAYHDDGDYIVLSFGTTSLDDIKTISDAYFVPTGFTADTDSWQEDEFTDGTACEYRDYIKGDILIEYLVYSDTEYGNILQVEAFDLE